MISTILLLKLILSPFFTALVALIQKKFSHGVGGAVSGLPLTAGPISLFLAIEQGLPFAREAATMTLAAMLATSAYAFVFILLSRKFTWMVSLVGGLFAWGLIASLLSLFVMPFGIRILSAFLAVLANVLFASCFSSNETPKPQGLPWDIPIRSMTVLVPLLAVTGLAHLIGPKYSGLLGSFPAMWSVLFSFTLAESGHHSVVNFFKGAAFLFGFPVFFCAIIFVRVDSTILLYLIASIVALATSYLMYRLKPFLSRILSK